jgi:chemotaxis protein MotA
MLALIGMLVVTGSVLGGFLSEGGPIGILIQPVEMLIIFGSALGTLLISTPLHHIKSLLGGIIGMLKGAGPGKAGYQELLVLQYELFVNARKHGFIALERDIAEPEKSSIISKYPKFLANHHAVTFLMDSLRLLVDGAVSPMDLDSLLDRELETHHEEATKPAAALTKVGDTLPGLGIVAAVLGIIIAMGKIDGPAAEMGHAVAVALVGTFLGVLGAYGFVNPLSVGLEAGTEGEANYFACMKAGMVAFAKGSPPSVAIEFARRVIYSSDRPTGAELETAIQGVTPR